MDFKLVTEIPCDGLGFCIRKMGGWYVVDIGDGYHWLRIVDGAKSLAEAKQESAEKLSVALGIIRDFDLVEQMNRVA